MSEKKVNSESTSNHCVLRLALSARVIVLIIALAVVGCGNSVERVYHSPYRAAFIIAVVPFLNQSGSENLDVMAVTDEFYTELQQVTGGLQVIPVNRVLAALTKLGMRNVSNPDEVMMLAEQLGADAIIVGTVTRYDPYQPPRMGMALQLYHREKIGEERSVNNIDPGNIARRGRAFEMPGGVPLRPEAMVVRIFDADRKEVIARIKKYTRHRQADTTPSGWRKFLTSRNYLRFVCYEMIGELLAQEQNRLARMGLEAVVLDDPQRGPGEK